MVGQVEHELEVKVPADALWEIYGGLELGKVSKWLVIASYIAVIFWKHDAEALWFATGSLMNAWLSIILKHIINHDRPASAFTLRSDPGMPSSHAQSIFFIVAFFIWSLVSSLVLNKTTVFVGVLALASGSYLSWLRVSQNLHTISQVFAGAIVGATFSLLWFHAWYTFVLEAFIASLWVRMVVIFLASAAFPVGLCLYVIKHLLREEI
ncbi:Lipid phosphate phosphatase epsilon 2 protein [Thalictrum thalictroides]|uniref:Lipid phosphate phosphatase epsilon 2 protein n=1 Tax=Thalictrum thalictroides TaxID=46969 RepID=A0A7J6XAT7_THATH|nr:Lipid phosphate phosphatase epsilon 2 protein [Thalictrum thalictroides]